MYTPAGSVQAELETTAHVPLPVGGTTSTPSKSFPGAAKPRLGTAGYQGRAKRKDREGASDEGKAKLFRLETPTEETLLGPPPPDLDPGVDSLIDSLLTQINDPLSPGAWVLGDESVFSAFSALQGEDAAATAETADKESPSVLAETNQVYPEAYGNTAALDWSEPAGTTPISFFESVLSEVSYSSHPGASPDERVLGDEAKALGEALDLLASSKAPPGLPDSRDEPNEPGKSPRSLSPATPGGETDSGALSSPETSQSDSSSEVNHASLWIKMTNVVRPHLAVQLQFSPRVFVVTRDGLLCAKCVLRNSNRLAHRFEYLCLNVPRLLSREWQQARRIYPFFEACCHPRLQVAPCPLLQEPRRVLRCREEN
ncbi:hypothetical protein EPH_0010240 [Eimeria praecox]|uniref:Uncharacterized protein n=1 Tax=Eimeria praecox TaxID=51316 RepID=U6G107_9EIME|nr:hypothetical protein EPH_0010240 [Eimeria praecox]